MPRRGTCPHAPSARTLRGDAQKALSPLEDDVLRSVQRPVHVNRHSIKFELPRRKPQEVARSVRYRGRVSLRKQEEPAPGSERADGCAARRASPLLSREGRRDASEKEGGHGLRPCEETRAPVGDRTSCSLQKSAGRVLVPNTLARSAPKRVAVRVNGGLVGKDEVSDAKALLLSPSSMKGSLVRRPSPLSYLVAIGEGPAKTQDDVRASSSGCLTQPKAVRPSRDRGCKGHRILRRVLVDGRHLGLYEPSPFTRRWSRQPWRLPHAGEQELERAEASRSTKVLRNPTVEEEATEVSEARLHWAPWEEKLPRSDPRLESTEERQRQRVSTCSPPKRSRVS